MRFFKKYLSAEDLAAITAAISAAEEHTVGEIRVCIRHRRHWKERKLTLHELTVGEFDRLGMRNTVAKTGVLILLLISERAFHIIGDVGIHAHVGDAMWEETARMMGEQFKHGNFREGLIAAVRSVGERLQEHFPKTGDDRNELSDDVVVR